MNPATSVKLGRARLSVGWVVALLGCSSGAVSSGGPAASEDPAKANPAPGPAVSASASSAAPASATAASAAAPSSAAPSASASAAAAPAERKACPSFRELSDLGDVSNGCHVYAATSKEWLQKDLVAKPCNAGYAAATGCVELAPDGCEPQTVGADYNAFGGPVLVYETSSGYYFYGVDGKARFAVAEGCQSFGLAIGEGRFVLGARAVESDGDPHYGRVTGVDGYPNAPQLLNLPPPYQIPRIVSAKAELIGNVVRTVNGKRESKVNETDTIALLDDAAIIKPKGGAHLDVMKVGSAATAIVTPPAGTIIEDFDANTPDKRIAWVEQTGTACELVVAKFAETADKIEAKRLGAVPCEAVAVRTEWAAVGSVLVHLADGKRKAIPPCEGARCGERRFTLLSTSNVVISVASPQAFQSIPIASLAEPAAAPAASK